MGWVKGLVLFLMFLCVFSLLGSVSAASWTVNPGSSIQSVINGAASNDVITVNDKNGSDYTYTENLVINKKLQLKAKTGGKVTLKASNSSKPTVTVNSNGNGTLIQGFIIRSATNSSGIIISGASKCTITNNTLTGNYHGVYLSKSNNNTVTGNILTNNSYTGIVSWHSNYNVLQNNVLNINTRGIRLGNCSYNTIQENSIINSTTYGIGLESSHYNTFQNNNITGTTNYGVYIGITGSFNGKSNNNLLQNNTLKENTLALYLNNSDTTLISNTVINNQGGIYLYNSSSTIKYNRISGNSLYGLCNDENKTVTATNNWWGTNTPLVSTNTPVNIVIMGGVVNYNSWIVLNTSADPEVVFNQDSTITVDLTHDNNGQDTSTSGHLPDNIPVNFITDLGTIVTTAYTRNGKINVTFSHSAGTIGMANITSNVDNQTKTITVDMVNDMAPIITLNYGEGSYTSNLNITLTAFDDFDSNPLIFYSFNNGTTWYNATGNVTWSLYENNWDILYYGGDSQGHNSPIQNVSYVIDGTGPYIWANNGTGLYNQSVLVNLTASDNVDTNPMIYYTLDGSNPTNSSILYTGPLNITKTTTLKFVGMDNLGNIGSVVTKYYILSSIGNLNTGNGYDSIQDAIDDSLTLNGHIIEVASGNYTENVVVNKNLTIKSRGNVDIKALDNSKPVFTINSVGSGSKIIGFNIVNSVHSSILLNSTNYCSILNNSLLHNSCIELLNSNNNFIMGNIVFDNDGINIKNSCNNWISNNTVSTVINVDGLILSDNSLNNTICGNIFHNNCGYGVGLYGCGSTKIYGNKFIWNSIGIFNSVDIEIYENDIETGGIDLENAVANIHFNRIWVNTFYCFALANKNSIVNATNNWWGTNNVTCINSTSRPSNCSIWNNNEVIIYDSWLVLTINSVSYKIADGVYGLTIKADLNHSNNGEDVTCLGYIPDNVPISFGTNLNVTNLSYTKNGMVTSIFNFNDSQLGNLSVCATLDNQNVFKLVETVSKAVLTISSTALDFSSGHWELDYDAYCELEWNVLYEFGMSLQEYCYYFFDDPYAYNNRSLMPGLWDYCYDNLNLYYEIPLNESVTQVSVLWKEHTNVTDPFKNELDIIINGNIVQSKVFTNAAYLALKNYYSGNYSFIFFEAISKINSLFATTKNSTGEDLQAALSLYSAMLDPEDFDFIMNNRLLFTDQISITLSYPGESAKTINIASEDGSNTFNLDFGGNLIQRMSTILYRNGGYYHVLGDPYSSNVTYEYREAGYEGVRSFALVTTNVTDDILRYWYSKKSLYEPGPMKAAYGTFMTALSMIKCHDIIADHAAVKFNVTWVRATPIVVSVCDDYYDGYLTLECDHGMGMFVTGESQNVKAFKFVCSAAINPIEYGVMSELFPNCNGSSITIDLSKKFLNGEILDIFWSNGYWVVKSAESDKFLVMDPETGILRDIMIVNSTFSYSDWCYSNQQTDLDCNFIEQLLSNNGTVNLENVNPIWLFTIMSTFEVIPTLAGSSELAGSWPAVSVLLFCAVFFGGNEACNHYGWLPPEQCREIVRNITFELIKIYPALSLTSYLTVGGLPNSKQLDNLFYTTISILRGDKKVYDKLISYLSNPDNLPNYSIEHAKDVQDILKLIGNGVPMDGGSNGTKSLLKKLQEQLIKYYKTEDEIMFGKFIGEQFFEYSNLLRVGITTKNPTVIISSSVILGVLSTFTSNYIIGEILSGVSYDFNTITNLICQLVWGNNTQRG